MIRSIAHDQPQKNFKYLWLDLRFWIAAKSTNEKPRVQSGFHSGNLKSAIQNPKLVGLSLMALVLVVAGAAAQAQQAKKFVRIGYLAHTGRPATAGAFLQGLRDLGYVEGQNITIEYRWAESKYERLPELATDLVRSNVDLIVAVGGTEVVQAAQKATGTTPIVFVIADDPIEVGLVSNIARPAGNITGFSSMNAELDAKRLELLKEAIPSLTHGAVLYNPVDPGTAPMLKATEAAGRVLGVQLQMLEVRAPEEFERAFAAATKIAPEVLRYSDRLHSFSTSHASQSFR